MKTKIITTVLIAVFMTLAGTSAFAHHGHRGWYRGGYHRGPVVRYCPPPPPVQVYAGPGYYSAPAYYAPPPPPPPRHYYRRYYRRHHCY